MFHEMYKGKGKFVRRFSVDRVIEEMKEVKSKYKMDFVRIGDDLFAIKVDDWLEEFAEKLTVPQGLQDMVDTNQTGLAILKIIEIIGADSIRDLDPETIYFLNKILNQLKVKKIRNQILSQALPLRV